jgi:hypothetical protein
MRCISGAATHCVVIVVLVVLAVGTHSLALQGTGCTHGFSMVLCCGRVIMAAVFARQGVSEQTPHHCSSDDKPVHLPV